MIDTWYKNMVMYSVDVEKFYDSNGDGIGDLQGLSKRLDYLAGMGINCLWILPFYPSPNRDNGYDVTHYYEVDPRLGNLGDFSDLIDRANDLGIRIIIDLVVNHTSIKHPWFQEARKNPDSKYREYYVWSEEPLDFDRKDIPLIGEENTIWTYDEEAKLYYLHRFYKEQPDLNLANPEVRNEILRIMGFWLKLGVSGFRVDAAEMMVEPYGLKDITRKELIDFLAEMRSYASLRKGDAILLAETNIAFDDMDTYLKESNKMNMLFNFNLNQLLFLSLARKSAKPLYKALDKLPELDTGNEYLNFLRHHDELSLKLLTEKEYQDVLKAFAPDENMRIFERGIRRRLAPMLENDEQRLKLAYSLLFSLPGVPMIRYGDEIGMGDNLRLQGRNSVRTAMQWTDSSNGGFTAKTGRIPNPVISSGEYGYPTVNVAKAHRDENSFLNWLERLISARKQCRKIGSGEVQSFPMESDQLLVHAFNHSDDQIVFIHNLSDEEVVVRKEDIPLFEGDYFKFFADNGVENQDGDLRINPYGYIWLKNLPH
jgi:maltose alpha-D-glucosyltransferase/alpha-amylase